MKKSISKELLVFILGILSVFGSRTARADGDYDMGSPTLKDIWVDPANGADGPGRGSTRALALRSVRYAWALIPANATLENTGFRILLAPGKYSADSVPSQFQSVWGTSDYPVILQAADDSGGVTFPSVDVSLCNYFYIIGIHIAPSQTFYASNFSGCDHLLFRECSFSGFDSASADRSYFNSSFYQCQHVYFEQCEISGSSGSAIDMFASQYGHIKNCRIYDIAGNAIYLRGGTSYLTIEENTISHIGKCAILCSSHDTTSGLDNMVMPWVHYDVYDIKCYNNIIDHTSDAGFSCSGGFNIFFAFNTLYQTGLSSSLININLASHACSRDRDIAHERIDSGAWGTYYYDIIDSSKGPIPNKNIFIYNNIFYNSADSSTASSHFSIAGPLLPLAFNSFGPKPANADDDLVIKGNIIWNGKPDKLYGINESSGCGATNPTCNQKQLEADNLINAAEPEFIDAPAGNFHPKPASVIFTIAKIFSVPDFSWTGLPASPKEPPGNISNSVSVDRDSVHRNPSYPIAGAFVISISSVKEQSDEQNDISSMQSYPNPAGRIMTIGFQLLHQTHASLEVFDLLGNKVASLISSILDEGYHSIEWNTANIRTGKYFYRLATGSTTQTKQITVLR